MVATCAIAIMAKASKAGLTKTRLAPCVGFADAARLNTAFLKDTVDNILQAAHKAPIHGYMAYGPPGDGAFFDFLPPEFGLVEAWQPNFGDTLMEAFAGVLGAGHACACLVNADSPTLPPAYLAQAASALLAPGDRVVIGPSEDGGYYLIGARRLHPELFHGIAWSTAAVFDETVARANSLGLEIVTLPAWYDVDDAASLDMLRSDVSDRTVGETCGMRHGAATHTRALLAEGVGHVGVA